MKFSLLTLIPLFLCSRTVAGDCYLTNDGAITYPGTAAVNYATAATPDLQLTFVAPSLGVVGTPAESFEAIVWAADGSGCDYTQPYLGKTGPGASTINPTGSDPGQFTTPFTVSPITGAGPSYSVDIDTIFVTGTPGYSESGSTGTAYMCVEFQQFGCGSKVDFKTVYLTITYALDSTCSVCEIAQVTREGPINDNGSVAAPPLECEVTNAGPFTQGDEIRICVKYPDGGPPGGPAYLNDDVCFNYLSAFTAQMYQGSSFSAVANLLSLPSGGFQRVGTEECLDQLDTAPSPPMYSRECCITIVPSGEYLQSIEAGTSASLRVDATLISTYLNCPSQVGGSRFLEGIEGHRHLEDAVVSRASVTIPLVAPTDGTKTCDGNLFLWILQIIFGWLFKFCEL